MSLFEWKISNSIGHKEIDAQHQQLFYIASQLRNAIKDGRSNEIILETTDNLINYCKNHFNLEEQLMLENNYPNYDYHKSRHQGLTNKLHKIKEEINPEELRASLVVLELLIHWIQNHILEDDKHFSNFMISNNK